MLDAFTRQLGIHQGRIPSGDGVSFVYELGHALLADALLNLGDYHEISQDVAVAAGSKTIRVALTITVPELLPVGMAWEVSAWLNNVKVIKRRLRQSKRKLTITDWYIGLAGAEVAPATNTVAIRLELV